LTDETTIVFVTTAGLLQDLSSQEMMKL